MEKVKTQYWIITFIVLFGGLIFLTLNKNSKSSFEESNYQYEAWADKGGYFVFLPWLVNHGLDADELDPSLSERMGNGFRIENGILKSKYSIGVAFLQLPFYLLGHLNAKILYDDPTGFEKVYMNWIGVGSVFYLLLSFFMIFKLLGGLISRRNSLLAILFIFGGTNLFQYSIDETLMSHVYSFFLLTLFSFGLLKEEKFNIYLLLSISILVVVLRPTNLFYLLIILLVFRKELKVSDALRRVNGMGFLIFGLLVLWAQLGYWWYAYGALYPKGYEGEGFEYLWHPKVLKTLFEPNNGWFLYAMPVFVGLIGSFFTLRNEHIYRKYLIFSLSIAFICTYITASWWTYTFGCGMGARNFVDFSVLWIILLGIVLNTLERNKVIYGFMIGLNLVFVIINLMITYHYDNCWFGSENWDWDTYFRMIR